MSSFWPTLISSASAIESSRICERKVFSLDSATSARCASSSRRFSPSRWRCHLVVDQLLRNRDLDLRQQLVDDLVARLHALAELLRLAELLAQVGTQLADGVELAGDLGEVVVGGRQLALLDADHGHGDLGGLALVVATEQRRLEGGGLAGGEGVEGIVDAVDQLAGAELVGDVRCGVDLFAADGRDQVEVDEVAGLGGAVDGDEGAEPGTQVLQLVLHLIRSHRHRVDLELQRVVLREGEVGANVDLDGELQVAGEVLLVRPLGDVGLGTPERTQLLGVGGLAVELVEPVADGVVQHLGAADALVDDGRRHLALAEAGDVHRLRDVLVGVLDAGLELFWRDGDAELHAGRAELLDGRADHGVVLLDVIGGLCGRGDRIRTCDLPLPKRALYQAELRPVVRRKKASHSLAACAAGNVGADVHTCWHGRHRDPGGARVRGALPRVR